jgi:uncharacterized protein YukE
MADARKLLRGLEDYQKHLLQHVTQLQQEYQHLEGRWHAFRDVYAGDAADQFKPGWEQTAQGFREYLQQTKQIMSILEERIESLRKANQKENDLPS